jgi:hypothetical protein
LAIVLRERRATPAIDFCEGGCSHVCSCCGDGWSG